MLNTEFFNLLTEGPADDIRRFLLRLAFDKYEIIAIIQIGTVLIDAFGIIGNQAVLLLTENLIQDCHRNPPAAYQLPEYIPGADASCLMHQQGISDHYRLPIKTIHIVEILNSQS